MSYQHQILGTIIASVLDYDELCKITSDSDHVGDYKANYAPCDGRSILGSKLATTGIANTPDLRGRFLRGLNVMYNHGEFPPLDLSTADPDGTDRRVGIYQSDEIKKHAHHTHDHQGAKVRWWLEGNLGSTGADRVGVETAEAGGNESRPRNVSVYYYIKIN